MKTYYIYEQGLELPKNGVVAEENSNIRSPRTQKDIDLEESLRKVGAVFSPTFYDPYTHT